MKKIGRTEKNSMAFLLLFLLFPLSALATEQYVVAEMFARTEQNGAVRVSMEPPESERAFWVRVDARRWMFVKGLPKEQVANLQKNSAGPRAPGPETKPAPVKSSQPPEPASFDVQKAIEAVNATVAKLQASTKGGTPGEGPQETDLVKTLLTTVAAISRHGSAGTQTEAQPAAAPPASASDSSSAQRFTPPPPIFPPSLPAAPAQR